MARLLQVPLFSDEILLSYLGRFASANGRATSKELCRDFGRSYEGIAQGEIRSISEFAALSDARETDLARQSAALSLKDGVLLFGERYLKSQIARNVIRVCPRCVAEDDAAEDRMPGTRRYRRAQWLLWDYHTCEKHSCSLIALGRQIPSHDFLDGIEVDVALQHQIENPVWNARAVAERFLSERLSGYRRHGDLLDNLSTSAVLDVSQVLGSALTKERKALSGKLEPRAGLDVGVAALLGSEQGLFNALDEIAALSQQGGQGTSRYWRVSSQLLSRSGKSEYRAVCVLVEEHNARRLSESGKALRLFAPDRSGEPKKEWKSDIARWLTIKRGD